MKKHILLVLFAFACLYSSAQTYTISGKVTDKKTAQAIEMAGIRLMKSDSSYVSGTATSQNGSFSVKATGKRNYILKITSIGYKPTCINITPTAQKTTINLGTIALAINDVTLKQATVSAHVAQVEVNKDTIQFNAEAYRTPEGSTLEALVDKLPGAEIDDNGGITINGKTVSQILIDGKDFFKGDTKVAMKNLPVDLIQKIKTYDKQSDYTKQTGIDDGNEETVLDVNLKQKIKSSWITNLDLAAGSKNRFADRVFITRFTDNSRISFTGNLNNVNDRGFRGGGPGFRGGGGGGLTASRSAGFDGYWNNGIKEDSAHYFQIGGNLRISHSSSDNLSKSNSETFLASANSFSNSMSQSYSKKNNFNSEIFLDWKPDSMTSVSFRPEFSHSTSNDRSISQTATFNSDPYDYGTNPLDSMFGSTDPTAVPTAYQLIAVNRNLRNKMGDEESNSVNGELNITRKLGKKGRTVSLRAEGGYSDSKSNDFSISDIYYFQRQTANYNNQYSYNPSKSWNYRGELSYSEPLWKDWYFQGSYQYTYRYSDRDRNYYQLDELDGYNSSEGYPIGTLPDGTLLHEVKNMENSQYATYKNYIQQINVGIRYVTKEVNFSAGVRMQPQRTDLHYMKDTLDTNITRHVFNISPDLRLRYTFNQFTRLDFRYRGSSSQPSMTDLLDITDTSDPLNISKGNPGLKPSWNNSFRLFFNSYIEKHQQSIFAHVNFSQTSNSISNAVTYDNETGIKTTRPENINGNWDGHMFAGYNRAFGKDNAFTLGTGSNINYSNSVGYMSVDKGNSQKNTVKTLTLGERLRATYRWDLFEFGLNGSVNYSKSRSELRPESNLETFRFNYGGNLQYTTPWNTSISTDLSMNSRRGYDDASMNTNELIWNAQLSQTLFKNTTTLSIQIYDILHNQSNISRTINAQMRRDSWSNAINSYFMVHLIYRLNIFSGAGKLKNNNQNGDRGMDGPGRGFGGGQGGYGGGNRGGYGGGYGGGGRGRM